ncbi:MAG: B12-binding domain-containing radical SAM protein [Deltaproteobacteria bacterium]|nr:B12-binding domain-containing radical SAM protein [Deltaproteobacteria bacterium]
MKPRRILLVYPEAPRETYWSFKYALSFIHKKSAMPPLGLVTIASYIPDTYDVRLVDENIEKLSDKLLSWADMVFVSAMIVQKDSFKKVVARAKAAGKTVVAGGPYPSGSREEITGVDHFILGEAEEILPVFFRDLEKGEAKTDYRAETKPDMATVRIPRFELLKMNKYASMSIQYSRGCPFHCEFCDIWKVYGNRPRLKSAHSMLLEMEKLYSLGWRGAVFMVDDNFIGNKGRVKDELLPAMIEWQKIHRHPFRFFTEASINLAEDDALLAAMRDAAFNEVFIGIETPSAEGLAETGKTQNLKCDMPSAIKKIQSYGIEVMAGFILGFDSDTEDIAERQIKFIQETGIARAMVGLLTALPGTDLFNRLKSEGRLLSASDGNNTSCEAANFVTRQDAVKLRDGYCKVLNTIYDVNLSNYFERCNKILDNIDTKSLPPRQIRAAEILMLVRSLARQPFTPYGLSYLKFIGRNMKNFGVFGEAVKFSIVGHHLHTITRRMVQAS